MSEKMDGAKPKSIRTQLIRTQLLGTILVLFVCSLSFMANDLLIFKRSVEQDLKSTSLILERSLLPALAFGDKGEATKTLSSLEAERTVVAAAVFGGTGELFAKYGADTSIIAKDTVGKIEGDVSLLSGHLIFHHTLSQNGDKQGDLYLDADIRAFATEYQGHVWILTLVFAVGFILSYLLARLMQKSLSTPIGELASMAKTISEDGVYTLRMKPTGGGQKIEELEILTSEFNRMLEQIQARDDKILADNIELERRIEERTAELKETQKNALMNAHAAGMAEIATGVLHNIGNITNSVNASTEEVLQIVRNSRTDGLLKGAQLLRDNQGDLAKFLTEDSKGKILVEYILQACGVIREEHERLKNEAASMLKKISLIKDVIHTQQDYAKQGLFAESLPLKQVVEETLNLQINALSRHGVQVIRKYDETIFVKIQKVKFAHILMNLIKNAKEAMDHKPEGSRRLSIETGRSADNSVYLKISDTGHGISKDSLEKIFNHGFTTKKTGHGFGLHFCANAMTEMDGRLSVDSEGVDKGATFTLFFPDRNTGNPKEVA